MLPGDLCGGNSLRHTTTGTGTERRAYLIMMGFFPGNRRCPADAGTMMVHLIPVATG